MPTKKGYSDKTIGQNIKIEMDKGKSYEQALAIALSIAEQVKKQAKKK